MTPLTGLFADVMFELDDGSVPAHKAILTARCDVMKAMFSGDFRESSAKVVSVRDFLTFVRRELTDTSMSNASVLWYGNR